MSFFSDLVSRASFSSERSQHSASANAARDEAPSADVLFGGASSTSPATGATSPGAFTTTTGAHARMPSIFSPPAPPHAPAAEHVASSSSSTSPAQQHHGAQQQLDSVAANSALHDRMASLDLSNGASPASVGASASTSSPQQQQQREREYSMDGNAFGEEDHDYFHNGLHDDEDEQPREREEEQEQAQERGEEEQEADRTIVDGADEALAHVNAALDDEQQPTQLYGGDGPAESEDASSLTRTELEAELERVRGEKEASEAQYRALLGKLTTMRNTLGDRLKRDADELDRREGEIAELRAANDDLADSLDTLRRELVQSHEDHERAHGELEQLRARAFDTERQSSSEALGRETALRDAHDELERVRLERDDWEDAMMRERVRREQLEQVVAQQDAEREQLAARLASAEQERDREAESAANLHAVLEEFQHSRERENRERFGELELQLANATHALDEFKQRAYMAESQLSGARKDSEHVAQLSQEVKEKNLLIGKLRHEAVIMNEHLREALRRLKKDSNEFNVDRRLVSNVLVSFITTPRQDSKRFEMLKLLSTILAWSDDQREQVGLQRKTAVSGPSVITNATPRAGRGHARSGKGKSGEDDLGANEVSPPSLVASLFTADSTRADVLELVDRVSPARDSRRGHQHVATGSSD